MKKSTDWGFFWSRQTILQKTTEAMLKNQSVLLFSICSIFSSFALDIFCPSCFFADFNSCFNEKFFGRLTKKVTSEPRRTQIRIKMMRGSLNWTSKKFTVTVCILAKEIIAMSSTEISSVTYCSFRLFILSPYSSNSALLFTSAYSSAFSRLKISL